MTSATITIKLPVVHNHADAMALAGEILAKLGGDLVGATATVKTVDQGDAASGVPTLVTVQSAFAVEIE